MLVNLHTLSVNSYTFFKAELAISNLQKRIAILVVILLGILAINLGGSAISYIFKLFWKNRKIEKKVDLSYRKITAVALDRLPSDLHSLSLKGADLTEIVELHKKLPLPLKDLDLSCVDLTKADLKQLSKELESLNLSNTLLTHLRGLPPSLKRLDLSYCQTLTPNMLSQLPKKLEVIILTGCHLKGEFIGILPPSLRVLGLSNYRLTIGDMKKIQHLPLTSLNVSNWDLSNNELDFLPSTLVELDLSHNKKITGAGLSKLKSLLPNLSSLNLEGLIYLSDADVRELSPAIKTLSLNGCTNLTSDALPDLPLALSSLTLKAIHFPLTDENLSKLPLNLTSFNSSRCFYTREDFAKLPGNIKEANGIVNPLSGWQTNVH